MRTSALKAENGKTPEVTYLKTLANKRDVKMKRSSSASTQSSASSSPCSFYSGTTLELGQLAFNSVSTIFLLYILGGVWQHVYHILWITYLCKSSQPRQESTKSTATIFEETMALLGFPSCTEHADDVLLAGPQNQIGFMICFSVWGWGAHMTSIVSIRLSATGWTSAKHIVKHTWMKWYDVTWGLMLNIYKEGLPLGQLNWVVPLVKLQGVQTMWMQYLLRCPRILLNFFKSWCHVLCLTDHFIWYDLILYNIMWYCIKLYYMIFYSFNITWFYFIYIIL